VLTVGVAIGVVVGFALAIGVGYLHIRSVERQRYQAAIDDLLQRLHESAEEAEAKPRLVMWESRGAPRAH
jgi:hypothetical protein